MRYKRPDMKNALSIIESAKKTMDYTLTLEINESSATTILRNIYECFRMLGDAILVNKGINSEDHLLPLKEISSLSLKSIRPISSIENLRILRHNINSYGYSPNILEVQDAVSLAKDCFFKAYDVIKKKLN
jgi:hypothetical protein